LTATAGPDGQPMIDNAPVGPNLAVAVRAGHYAWGCADTTALMPDDTLDVSVNVFDRPLDLSAADLTLKLDYSPSDPGPYARLFEVATTLLGEAFIPDGSSEGAVLLNAMEALAPPTAASAFAQQRIDKDWDALVEQHLAATMPGLRSQVEAWAV